MCFSKRWYHISFKLNNRSYFECTRLSRKVSRKPATIQLFSVRINIYIKNQDLTFCITTALFCPIGGQQNDDNYFGDDVGWYFLFMLRVRLTPNSHVTTLTYYFQLQVWKFLGDIPALHSSGDI